MRRAARGEQRGGRSGGCRAAHDARQPPVRAGADAHRDRPGRPVPWRLGGQVVEQVSPAAGSDHHRRRGGAVRAGRAGGAVDADRQPGRVGGLRGVERDHHHRRPGGQDGADHGRGRGGRGHEVMAGLGVAVAAPRGAEPRHNAVTGQADPRAHVGQPVGGGPAGHPGGGRGRPAGSVPAGPPTHHAASRAVCCGTSMSAWVAVWSARTSPSADNATTRTAASPATETKGRGAVASRSRPWFGNVVTSASPGRSVVPSPVKAASCAPSRVAAAGSSPGRACASAGAAARRVTGPPSAVTSPPAPLTPGLKRRAGAAAG